MQKRFFLVVFCFCFVLFNVKINAATSVFQEVALREVALRDITNTPIALSCQRSLLENEKELTFLHSAVLKMDIEQIKIIVGSYKKPTDLYTYLLRKTSCGLTAEDIANAMGLCEITGYLIEAREAVEPEEIRNQRELIEACKSNLKHLAIDQVYEYRQLEFKEAEAYKQLMLLFVTQKLNS